MPVDAGSIFSEVRIRLDKLKQDISGVEVELDKFGKENEEKSKKHSDEWDKSFNLTKLAGIAAFAAIAAAVKASVETFISFEDNMAQVHATMTGSENDFKRLEDAALGLASATDFTTQEASDALLTFARFGKTAEESILLLSKAEFLAEATGSGLNDSAKLLVQVMNQFGIAAENSDRIINVLAAAKMPITEFSSTLASIGPIAKGMNIPLEEIVSVMKLLTQTGLESGQATQALRIILGDLSDTTSPIVKKLSDLGVSFDKVNPATNNFAKIIGNLEEAGLGASDMMAIFGNRAGPVMATLLAQGRAGIDSYTQSITGTDEAAKQYAIRNDTLADSFKEVQSKLEVIAIQFAKEFAPALKAGGEAIKIVLDFIMSIPAPLKILIGAVAAGIPIIMGLGASIKMLSGLFTGFGGPLAIAAVAITVVIGGLMALARAMDYAQNAQEGLRKTGDELRTSNEEIKKINDQLSDSTKTLTQSEKDLLEQRRELLKQNMQYALASQVKSMNDARDAAITLNSQIKAQQALYDSLTTSGTATRDMYQAAYGPMATYGGELERQGTKILPQLSKEIVENTAKRDDLNATYDETAELLADAVQAQTLEISAIRQTDVVLASHVQSIIEDRKRQADLNASIAEGVKKTEEQTQAQRAATAAALAYAKQISDMVKSIIDGNKTELQRLEETYAQLNQYRFADVAAEKQRVEALRILGEQIAAARAEQNKEAIDAEEEYRKKIEELQGATDVLMEKERARAIATVAESAASQGAKDQAIAAINEYYDALKDKTAEEEFAGNMKTMLTSVRDGFFEFSDSLSSLFDAITQARIDQLDAQMQAELEAAGVAEATAVEKAQAELDAAIEAGDAETVVEKQKALKKAQIEEDFERKKAQLQYQGAMAGWALSLTTSIASAAEAIVKAVASAPWPFNLPAIGFATAIGGLNVAAVGVAKPVAPAFQYGGIVEGAAGVDQVDIRATRGEMVLTHADQVNLLDMIRNGGAQSKQGGVIYAQLIVDGLKQAEGVARYFNGGLVKVELK